MKETIEAHRVEHGFEKMQDGGVNGQFGQSMERPMGPMVVMPWYGYGGMGGGYQHAWYGCSHARSI